jgi:hypothetical protein
MTSKMASSSTTCSPSDALIQLIAPDGYYTYLGIPRPTATEIAAAAESVSSSFLPNKKTAVEGSKSAVNDDQVKKAYRYVMYK